MAATAIPANRVRLEARAVAAETGGRVVRDEGRVAIGASTDSRALAAGSAFVALRGATSDGHDHQRAAVDAGAVLLVVERGRALEDPRADAVEVDDTLAAWGLLARAHLRAWRARTGGRVVAITGSAGKTTTKELCAALLEAAGPVCVSPGNLNNLVGLPAAALGITDEHRFAVLEAGMSVPGEMERLGAVAEPDVAVVTNVGLAHAGGVGGTIDGVARQKGALYAALREGGVAVAPAEDGPAMAQLRRARGRRHVTFGRGPGVDYRVRERTLVAAGSRLAVETPRGAVAVELPLAGEAAALDFAAALAAAEAASGRALTRQEIDAAMRRVVLPPGRAAVLRSPDGTVILDDSYNANPASMRAAFATLEELARGRRAVAVLGEMRELGDAARSEHEALGDLAAAAGVAVLVGCGGMADLALERARARGVEVLFARDAKEAAAVAARVVRPGDVILVKGSRGVATEVVVEALRERTR